MTKLVRLETLSQAENFNAQVWGRVEPYLGKRVLEVGMGIGIFTERLLAGRELVVGVELVAEFLDAARERLSGRPGLEMHQADMGAGIPSFLADRTFDTIVCMNVLEHIEDDERTLRDFRTLLAPGGRLVLVVPQYPWLYNGLDSNDGHFRRYTRADLRAKLERAGLPVEATGQFNMTAIAGWFVNGTLLGRKDLPTGQMKLYDVLAPLLFRLEALIGPPLGLSLLMTAVRPR